MISRILTTLLVIALQPVLLADDAWRENLALEHISRVQGRDVIVWDEYQISNALESTRKSWLADRLKRFCKVHLSPHHVYQVVSSKRDGDLAMVVLSSHSPADPFLYESFALGFCLVEQGWKVAPINGSFSLTGIGGYNPEESERRKALENWALDQVSAARNKGQKEQLEKYQKQIKTYHAQEGALSGESRSDAALLFLRMCREKNVYGAMACLRERGHDFDDRRALIAAFDPSSISLGSWKYLLTRNYLFTVLPSTADKSLVSVAIYAPSERLKSQILEFRVHRVDGLWQIELPDLLKTRVGDAKRFQRFQKYRLSSENRKRLGDVKSAVLSQLKSHSYSSSGDVLAGLKQSLKDQNLLQFFGLLNWKSATGGQPINQEERTQLAEEALLQWQSLIKSNQSNIELIAESESQQSKLLTLLFYSSRSEIKFSLMPSYLFAVNGKWSLYPSFDLKSLVRSGLLDDSQEKEFAQLQAKVGEIAYASILPKASKGALDDRAAVDAESLTALEAVYQLYAQSMQLGKLADASQYLFCQPGGESDLMKFVGYESFRYNGPRTHYEFVSLLHSGHSAAIIMRLSYPEGADEYSFYPAVYFEDGFKMLPQLSYYYEDNRGAKLLNSETINKVRAVFDEQFIADYTSLIKQFSAEVEKQLAK